MLENYVKTHSREGNQPFAGPANSINGHTPRHAFPIGTAQSTQLPPWEDFQRGPHSARAETSHPLARIENPSPISCHSPRQPLLRGSLYKADIDRRTSNLGRRMGTARACEHRGLDFRRSFNSVLLGLFKSCRSFTRSHSARIFMKTSKPCRPIWINGWITTTQNELIRENCVAAERRFRPC